MKSGISSITVSTPTLDIGEVVTGAGYAEPGGWQEIASRVSSYVAAPASKTPPGPESLNHLSGLLRLQLDVTHYQLRVEVVSKVAESAVASLRKLQQSQ